MGPRKHVRPLQEVKCWGKSDHEELEMILVVVQSCDK